MPDIFTKKRRSEIMARVRGRGNKRTEIALIKLMKLHRITGWRRHPKMFGNPDFIFPAFRLIIFVDGCFWHGCPKHSTLPVNNRDFWMRKFESNRRRDRLVTRTLKAKNWHIIRIWQHELTLKRQLRCVRRIQRAFLLISISKANLKNLKTLP